MDALKAWRPMKHTAIIRSDYTTSARCFATRLSARFLGLGRPTALAILAFSLQLAKVFRASLGDLLPTLPSKLDGGGIFLFSQNLEGVASTPDDIMHEQEHARVPLDIQ